MDFLQYEETKRFFTMTDLVVSLGGINNSVGVFLGSFSILFLIQFSYFLKRVLHKI